MDEPHDKKKTRYFVSTSWMKICSNFLFSNPTSDKSFVTTLVSRKSFCLNFLKIFVAGSWKHLVWASQKLLLQLLENICCTSDKYFVWIFSNNCASTSWVFVTQMITSCLYFWTKFTHPKNVRDNSFLEISLSYAESYY